MTSELRVLHISFTPALYGYGVFCKVLIINGKILLSVATVPVFRMVATLC